ncbi:hypothetical protein CS022_01970 [Veronia nyctiphanis]|uniref:Uncharacterized protein n=1 Tax=Veronia nyctiphanis TaxID=1278244 RepID=A0A4Q0YZ51_9GAMM|nr:hypothetical protein [Veronia nyctiphanis]RXJ74401.1 hypothetical protein CS022_01970 [Veronia nyctiphanis]
MKQLLIALTIGILLQGCGGGADGSTDDIFAKDPRANYQPETAFLKDEYTDLKSSRADGFAIENTARVVISSLDHAYQVVQHAFGDDAAGYQLFRNRLMQEKDFTLGGDFGQLSAKYDSEHGSITITATENAGDIEVKETAHDIIEKMIAGKGVKQDYSLPERNKGAFTFVLYPTSSKVTYTQANGDSFFYQNEPINITNDSNEQKFTMGKVTHPRNAGVGAFKDDMTQSVFKATTGIADSIRTIDSKINGNWCHTESIDELRFNPKSMTLS